MNTIIRLALAGFAILNLAGCQAITAERTIGTKPISVLSGTIDGRTLDASLVKDGQTLVYNKRARSLAPDRTVDDATKSSILADINSGNIGAAIQALNAVQKAGGDAMARMIDKNRDMDEQFIVTPDAGAAATITAAFYADTIAGAKVDLSLHSEYTLGVPPVTKPPVVVPSVTNRPALTNAPPVPDAPPVTNAVPATNAPADAVDLSGTVTLGTHAKYKPQNAAITRELRSARIEGGQVRLDYQPLGWPDGNSGIGPNIDGRVYLLWVENGQLVGGHFDWKRPGQTVKTLANVRGGYLDGRQPPIGAPVLFGLLSNDGRERTNFVLAENTWQG